MIFEKRQRIYPIDTLDVWEAFKDVRAGGKSPGVDGIAIDAIEKEPRKYLYPVWNRLASGSYLPPAVRQTQIPKGDGKMRTLGIPTVTDRVAQTVIKLRLEKLVTKHLSKNSFGYMPDRGAHDAIRQCQENCQRYSWVIDLDIKGFFDNIDHELMMKALKWFTKENYILLYVERWLKAPVRQIDGTLRESNSRGTPQGGVISPLLANIFLHFAFDKWFAGRYPKGVFERYADDIIIHCSQFGEAEKMLQAVERRLNECKLELNHSKTKLVYCNSNQRQLYPLEKQSRSFDFLGYTFKPRIVKTTARIKLGFSPGMSQKSQKKICEVFYKLRIHRMTHLTLDKLVEILRIKSYNWINYYGKFRLSCMRKIFRVLNFRLARWVRNKYRRFRRRPWYHAYLWLVNVSKAFPNMFVHWQYGFRP